MTKYVSLEHSIRLVCEDKVEHFHKVGVTYTDAGEKTMKHVRVKAKSEAHALEKAKAHFKKKGYRIHDAIHAGIMKEDINNTDKFVGDKKPETIAPTPVIRPPNGPAGSQSGKEASLDRAHKAQNTSATMGNRVSSKPNPNPNVSEETEEEKKKKSSGPDATDLALAAGSFVPGPVGTAAGIAGAKRDYDRGDYVGAGLGAAGALIPGVGYLAAGAKAARLAKMAKGADTAADVVKAAKVAKTADKVADVSKVAKTADTAADVSKVAKTADTAADVSKVAKTADKVADVSKVGKAGKTADAAKLAAGATRAAAALAGRPSHVSASQHGSIVGHKPNINVHMAKRHRVSEETESGTDDRETIEAMPRSNYKDRKDVQYVGRPDSASTPMDKRSVLIRQEIQKKVIDEDVKRKADIIRKVKQEKKDKVSSDSTTLGDGKTKTFGDVIINPKLNPQDYTGNVVP